MSEVRLFLRYPVDVDSERITGEKLLEQWEGFIRDGIKTAHDNSRLAHSLGDSFGGNRYIGEALSEQAKYDSLVYFVDNSSVGDILTLIRGIRYVRVY